MDPKELERAILQVLEERLPEMVAEQRLLNDVRIKLQRAITTAELALALQRLDAKHQVIGIADDDYTRWKISANGQARLASLVS